MFQIPQRLPDPTDDLLNGPYSPPLTCSDQLEKGLVRLDEEELEDVCLGGVSSIWFSSSLFNILA